LGRSEQRRPTIDQSQITDHAAATIRVHTTSSRHIFSDVQKKKFKWIDANLFIKNLKKQNWEWVSEMNKNFPWENKINRNNYNNGPAEREEPVVCKDKVNECFDKLLSIIRSSQQ